MGVVDRRARELAARRQLIVATARRIAEADGWDAVTTRRLATEVEYSQPVLYAHFRTMNEVADAVALEGFEELADTLSTARGSAASPADALNRIGTAYVEFAHRNPALYEAMFDRRSALHFASDDTPPPLVRAFAELHDAVAVATDGGDPDTAGEVMWAALHGLVTLGRTRRLRDGHTADRLDLLAALLAGQ